MLSRCTWVFGWPRREECREIAVLPKFIPSSSIVIAVLVVHIPSQLKFTFPSPLCNEVRPCDLVLANGL